VKLGAYILPLLLASRPAAADELDRMKTEMRGERPCKHRMTFVREFEPMASLATRTKAVDKALMSAIEQEGAGGPLRAIDPRRSSRVA
jgi:hypothetical protein